jgi:hypothetical protein
VSVKLRRDVRPLVPDHTMPLFSLVMRVSDRERACQTICYSVFSMSWFYILGITFSFELWLWWSWTFWKANKKLYNYGWMWCQSDHIQNHETNLIHLPLCLGCINYNFVCVFVFTFWYLEFLRCLVGLWYGFQCLVWDVHNLDHHFSYVQVHIVYIELYIVY